MSNPLDIRLVKLSMLRQQCQEKTKELTDLIEEHLKVNGLKEEDSQRVCVLNRIRSLEHAINGIEEDDLLLPCQDCGEQGGIIPVCEEMPEGGVLCRDCREARAEQLGWRDPAAGRL